MSKTTRDTENVAAQAPPARDVGALLAALDARLAAGAGDDAVTPPDGFVPDAKGRLVPERLVRAEERLENQTVRRILAYGLDLANQIARFRAHTADDLTALVDVLGEQYGRKRRGRKGNCTFLSYDGRLKVTLQVQDRIGFGAELQVARQLVDECLAEWSDGARDELRLLVQHAFEPDREGHINREAVFRLRRVEIDDPRWRQAQRAISDSVRVTGSRAYLRLYFREHVEADWRAVPIDLASRWTDPATPARPLLAGLGLDVGSLGGEAAAKETAR